MSEPVKHRLYRSRSDKMLGGVAAGLADYFDVDPVLIRLAWVVLTVLSGGIFTLAYLLLWVIVPAQDQTITGRTAMQENIIEVGEEARNVSRGLREALRKPTAGRPSDSAGDPHSSGHQEKPPTPPG
jgi:phage shock protein C